MWCNAVESWFWDHFTEQEQADEWERHLAAPPYWDPTTADVWATACELTIRVGQMLTATVDPTVQPDEWVPPGWDNDTLLAEMEAAARAA